MKKSPDNIITNLGYADELADEVNLSWEDINVFVHRNQSKWCCFGRGEEGKEDVLQILKKGIVTVLLWLLFSVSGLHVNWTVNIRANKTLHNE